MIRAAFLASRPLSWVNTAYPFAAAYLLASGRIDAPLVVGTVFFLVPYNLAMYGINDVFDYRSDLRNPRKGGVEGALLEPRFHRPVLWLSAVLAAPFVVALVALGAWPSWVVLAVSLFAVAAYSVPGLRFKEVPVLDSVTSSAHFVSPAAYGIALVGSAPDAAVLLVLGAFFLWGMASHAFGAVQDVAADRAAGIGSIATVLGARRTVRLAAVLYAVAGAILLATPWPAPLAALVAVPYVLNVLPWWNATDDAAPTANRGWRRFLWLNYLAGGAVSGLLILAGVIVGMPSEIAVPAAP